MRIYRMHSKSIHWRGWDTFLQLVDNGFCLDEIVDRWGRSRHPEANAFLCSHLQMKRMMLKEYIDANQEKRQFLRGILKTYALKVEYERTQRVTLVLQNAISKIQKNK